MTVTLKTPTTYDHSIGNVVCGPDSLGRFYVLGNSNSSGSWKAERFDPTSNTWTTVADVSVASQSQYYGAWHVDGSDRVIYATGYAKLAASSFQGTNRGYIYDPSANTWTAITSLPAGKGRWEPHFWSQSGLLYLAGGYVGDAGDSQDGVANHTTWTDTWQYSGGTAGTWTDLGAAMNYSHGARQRSGYKCPVDSVGRVYVIGGGPGATPNTAITGCERWNPATSAWNVITALPVAKRAYAWAVFPNDDIYITQGVNNLNALVKTTYRYNSAADTWSTLAPHPTTAIDGVGFYANGYFFVVGGRNGPVGVIYAYDPITDVWCATPDRLQAAQPYEMTPIGDGTGSFYLPEIFDNQFATPNHALDYYSPNLPNPCGPPFRPSAWTAVIG